MYIRVYICAYKHIYEYVQVFSCTVRQQPSRVFYWFIYVYVYMYIMCYICIHTYIYVYMYIYICIYICMYKHTFIYIHI